MISLSGVSWVKMLAALLQQLEDSAPYQCYAFGIEEVSIDCRVSGTIQLCCPPCWKSSIVEFGSIQEEFIPDKSCVKQVIEGGVTWGWLLMSHIQTMGSKGGTDCCLHCF